MLFIEMPKANENLTEATLDRWLVKEGDAVKPDQSLCDIITDKAKFELPSPGAGVVLKILGPERAVLPVGYVLCVLGESGESIPADLVMKNDAMAAAHRNAATAPSPTPPSTNASTPQPPPSMGVQAVRATPAARRVAREAGVDLAEVAAVLKLSGPVNEKDIKTFLELRKK